jgi:undecaprenyl-diphosphatase
MGWLEGAVLGLLQGLTEFLPVSSSGHLRLGQWLMGADPADKQFNNQFFEIYLHGITLLVVLAVFRKRLLGILKDKTMMMALFLSAVATVGVVKGFKLDDKFDSNNTTLQFVLIAEIITGLILFGGEWAARKKPSERLAFWQAALIIGVAQGFAVLPGISRSGSTIVCALALGWSREKAFDFAFLMSIPVIGGAMLLKTIEVVKTPPPDMPDTMAFVAGAIPAAVLGYLTLVGLRKWVLTSLQPFGYYCCALGILGLILIGF